MAESHLIRRTKRFKDLTGQTFGRWTVLGFSHRNSRFNNFWLCRCACGAEKPIRADDLVGLKTRSCGCRNKPKIKPARKRCRTCKADFPFTAEFFPTCAQHPFGLKAVCRECWKPVVNTKNLNRARLIRAEVLSHYSGGGKAHCVCCGTDFLEFLSIDHLNGGGAQDRRERCIPNICLILKKDGLPDGFQTLCHNCNMAIGKYGHCPHRPEIVRPVISGKGRRTPWIEDADCSRTATCFKCGQELPLNENFFHRHPKMAGGFLGKCKACACADSSRTSELRNRRIRLAVLVHYSESPVPECACCHETTLQFLAIDHIDGGGNQHRKQIKQRMDHHLFLSGFPSGYRVLCHNCNSSLGYYGNCPHNRA